MAYTSASSATTLPGPATYADPGLGRFGGITLRTLTTGGRTYPAGCLLSPELVMSFRPANRAALQSRGVILLFERELPPEVREKLEARDREIARQ
ncbi:MAG TPA: hypothetical protein VGU20_14015 [Stellaceae bacterium]|nr:hypothetical protein [Stellaceae bacterium]